MTQLSGAPVDFYFDFSSPYGYVAAELADDTEKRIGRPLAWRPMLLGPVFKLNGAQPLTMVPMKGDYSKRDFVRTARLHKVPFRQPDKFPIMSTKYYAIMGMYKELGDLETAINAEIAKAWAACENVALMSRYGLGDPDWFTPPSPDYRIGVDRPAGWKSPSAPESCFRKS